LVSKGDFVLKPTGYIDLPGHLGEGGFDHAAVHSGLARMYVAHTANNSLDVIDTKGDRYLHSIPGLAGVAGVLVSEQSDLVFSSNRTENSIALFMPGSESTLEKVTVGLHPNGLAFDEQRGLLLSAHVGDADIPASFTVALVDLTSRQVVTSIPVPGRTRWVIFDPDAELFYVNISSPPQIAVIDPRTPDRVTREIAIPAAGPHGLDMDLPTRRLFCACDDGRLICLNADTGEILAQSPLSGKPDVIFHNLSCGHLYVAVGDPGVIDLFDARTLQLLETVPTEKGAHTLGFDQDRNKIYAFCPLTHRAVVFSDPG
jgi:DNA-binding beta-propeller fold protein YncE